MMDVKIEVITGGGKKIDRESKSVTLKDVQSLEQVREALYTKFEGYFPKYQDLNKIQEKKKKGME